MSILEGLLGGFREGTEKSRMEERAEQDRQDRAMSSLFEVLLRTDSGELQKYGLMGLLDMASGQASPLQKGLSGFFGGREPHPMLGDIVAGITKASAQATGVPPMPAQGPGATPPAAGGPMMSVAGPTDLGRSGITAIGAPPPALEGITPAASSATTGARGGRIFASPADLAAQKAQQDWDQMISEVNRVFTDPAERAAVIKAAIDRKYTGQDRVITPNFDPGLIKTASGKTFYGAFDNTRSTGALYVDEQGNPIKEEVVDFVPRDRTAGGLVGKGTSTMNSEQAAMAYPGKIPNPQASPYWKVTVDRDGAFLYAQPTTEPSQGPVYPWDIFPLGSGGLGAVDRRNIGKGVVTVPGSEGREGPTGERAWATNVLRTLNTGMDAWDRDVVAPQKYGHTVEELQEIAAGLRKRGQKGPLTTAGAPPPASNATGVMSGDLTPEDALARRGKKAPDTPPKK